MQTRLTAGIKNRVVSPNLI